MTAKYFAILTNQGAARLANAAALGTKLNLTQMAVGDANGTLPTPDPAQTKLINQKRIAPLNLLTVDPANTSQIIAEQIIPENEGGFWIREIGLYDDDGILIAVANCPETYKPQLQEGSGRTQTIRMILIVSSTSAITLKIDPAVVLATRQYVDDKIIEVKGYADDLMKKHVEAANPHKQYPLIANALKEMVDAGLAGDVLKNLGLGELALAGATTGAMLVNGYVAIPLIISGVRRPLIIQWGVGQFGGSLGDDAGYLNNFPFAFPSACYVMVASHVGHTPSGAGILSASAITKSGFRGFSSVATAANPVSGCYVAIGG
ncbi:TPA: phage tail protein [Escherichia coli]|uniref:phage tail protein n=1 Tax=Escherichia coli TaxID=562 RepID=UPI0002BA644A|nr:phage tail protein [Escherichia coli]EFL0183368.1 phage tail protein [Escherichia coli]EGM8516416.1 phage tail protein [Escherichia coli]ENA30143.1 phage tail-collar fiber family protein [Escherichia coli BCE007_MS-11]ENB26997.1 phage tail-collar fiber family protein [Escherichia coli BCE030_MS-09]ENB33708.1 phage tail-collar fiber family protein [Escherichia coli BCE032_MS-12]